jgi:2',3'-cyclic-nucleotide 2'-phosphodiesterase (5'-nucleotidase family)
MLFAFVLWAITGSALSRILDATTEAHGPSQCAAEVMRVAGRSEGAFLPGGLVKEPFDESNLASLLVDPSDDLSVVQLRGSQVRRALEKSVAIYPSPNQGFLQLAGIEATFSRSSPPEKRIVSVLVAGEKLDDAKTYLVAMPGSLARGGLGYSRIWDRSQIQPRTTGLTLAEMLRGKKVTPTKPNWTAVD